MFGLIGHSTSLEAARQLADRLDYPEYAQGDLDMWCSAPPQLVERFSVTDPQGLTIHGAYIDSVFVPEMLRRFKTAKRKVLNAMELAQKSSIDISALGGFTSIIFEDMNLLREQQVRATTLEWQRFTTGNTHTAWVICQQVEANAPRLGIDLSRARVAVVGATGDIGSAVCRWLHERVGVAELLLVARKEQPLRDLQTSLGTGRILALEEALPQADVVVWVASLSESLVIDTASLRRPCLMIDGGYPKNLDSKAAGDGIHVIKGGIVEFHQDIDWQVVAIAADMARPSRQMFACFAEAMLLDFEQLHTNFSWGRNNITLSSMERIGEASRRHGFQAIGLETALDPNLAAA
ncbi:MAG: long-chain acyl-[acyl-carrier-protein] reductase [Cyanobacteriota bacterium]